MNEIENAVYAGIGAGDEIRPCDRTLGWNTGAERLVPTSSVAQLRQVRHLALSHQPFAQTGIHSVEADDDELGIPVHPPMTGGDAQPRKHERCRYGDCL